MKYLLLFTVFVITAASFGREPSSFEIEKEIMSIEKELKDSKTVTQWLVTSPPHLRKIRNQYFAFLKGQKFPKITFYKTSLVIHGEQSKEVINLFVKNGERGILINGRDISKLPNEKIRAWMNRVFLKKKKKNAFYSFFPKAFAASEVRKPDLKYFYESDFNVQGYSPWAAMLAMLSVDQWLKYEFSDQAIKDPNGLIERAKSLKEEYGLSCHGSAANLNWKFDGYSEETFHVRTQYQRSPKGVSYNVVLIDILRKQATIDSLQGEWIRSSYGVTRNSDFYAFERNPKILDIKNRRTHTSGDMIGAHFWEGLASVIENKNSGQIDRGKMETQLKVQWRELLSAADVARACCTNFQCAAKYVRLPMSDVPASESSP